MIGESGRYLYDNYRRLLANRHFSVEHHRSYGTLMRHVFEALWRETDEHCIAVAKDLARNCDSHVLRSFSQMLFYRLSERNKDRDWPIWASRYLRIRCVETRDDETRDDETFHLLGALMYNPSASESLELMKSLNLGEEVSFDSHLTPTLYSLLKALSEGTSGGRIDSEVGNTVLSRLRKVAPPYLWTMVPTN